MQKVFGIYFSDPGALDYPLNKERFFESYSEIIEELEKSGVRTVIVRNNSYLGNKEFSHYFIWNGETYKRIDEKIKIDLLWNRDSENVIPKIEDIEMLNRFEFDEICRDKIKTDELFGEFGGKTFLLNSFEDLKEKIEKIPTDKIVLKPRYGEQGRGIYILEKDQIKADLYKDWTDVLLQEFLDSSVGIKGIVEGVHEINIYFVNGGFAGCRVKRSVNGSLISKQEGDSIWKVWGLKEKDVPKDLLETVKKLDNKMLDFPLRLYRADFVNTKDGYKMIELNSRPGVMTKLVGLDFYWDFNGGVVELVKGFLK